MKIICSVKQSISDEPNRVFPCARQSRKNRGLIVLFTAETQGVVLSAEGIQYTTLVVGGDYTPAKDYPASTSLWKDFEGKIELTFSK